MEYKYSFEKLEVWSDARMFVVEIYKLTKTMPSDEKFGLCSQLQRATVSIVSNKAKGTTRTSDKEKIRFVEVAYGSLKEVYCQFCIAFDLAYISDIQLENQKNTIDLIAKKLSGLKNAYQKRLNS